MKPNGKFDDKRNLHTSGNLQFPRSHASRPADLVIGINSSVRVSRAS